MFFLIALASFLLPWLITAAVLYPAHLLAGGSRRRVAGFLGYALLLALLLLFGQLLMIPMTMLVFEPDVDMMSGVLILALSSAVLGIGGAAIIALVLDAMSPIRRPMKPMLLLGAAQPVLLCSSAFAMLSDVGQIADWLSQASWLVWMTGPLVVYYAAAISQRRALKRYLRADCVRCGYGKGSTLATCPECGKPPLILCAHCRRFADAAPGTPCPRCQHELGRRCWRCQYDWRGIENNRCPECGVWKPQ